MLKYTKVVILVKKSFNLVIKEGSMIENYDPVMRSFVEMTVFREGSKANKNVNMNGISVDE